MGAHSGLFWQDAAQNPTASQLPRKRHQDRAVAACISIAPFRVLARSQTAKKKKPENSAASCDSHGWYLS